jgi:MFS family permease
MRQQIHLPFKARRRTGSDPMKSAPPSHPSADRMTPLELRAGASLASLFALRMLGLFLILPVFAVHASHMAGGDNKTLVGLAMGIYGLSQGILQIPFGMASDRFGRKRVIVFGLVLFALGSFVASLSTDIGGVIIGRTIQGAGAISAAVVAMAADLTREQHRTKVMAMIGASIGLTFAVSLMAAPALYRAIGMNGIFDVIGVLAILAIAVTIYAVPPEPAGEHRGGDERRVEGASLGGVLRNVDLLRLNLGIFVLHMVQVAMFVVVPVALVNHAGLDVQSHWKVYLPAVLISFVFMMPPIMAAERRGKIRELFLAAIVLMLLVQGGFAILLNSSMDQLSGIAVLLTLFFVGFNILEASLPSLVSRIAPVSARGTAIGVYNTTQALGLAAGGVVGGWLAQHLGNVSVFVFGIAAVALWLVFAVGMKPPGRISRHTLKLGSVQNHDDLREQLVRQRGVREVILDPIQGIVVLSVYADTWDEQAVMKIIGGSA